jgi:hypothetical protein
MSECKHKQLARSCEICELENEVSRLQQELQFLKSANALPKLSPELEKEIEIAIAKDIEITNLRQALTWIKGWSTNARVIDKVPEVVMVTSIIDSVLKEKGENNDSKERGSS